ncbi:N-acetyl-1-D-myo-inositol-2-amino-2-deoxy-alpha-D-glucopyranoside deacetylase [Rhodococcus xishaensis]|uniref:1D-myo-inositol 2-acetamido-2-deoxy-alpha-D-glucopyranoside deacetylase n=1 Tax=Rhodococcus xishaensis TaxID=2487364 RepID=A0A3S3E0W4_9NOCA|nr:N-acetyl-1-D-myo-inositol-2-amino-2-deoxy-alpha-D-glucopyranoside deacetylase [Rhodococcus xishaensis]RVW02813.1 N-acetyl-1-D-myo-inositol-2-amino-2-deoxy-alpha-D-glucopyranoside deacetylase [Rhodococcus xishaensis]
MSGRRILFVHAHPDDETLTTGGAIARCASDGAEVTVLTCTLGEEGEVIGDRWAGLVVDRADQLGGYRILELTRALRALGASAPRFLGGAGRWRDSGMAGTASAANPRAFVNADPDEAVGALVAVIRELRPHVVVTYDPAGGYGHPDHVQTHRFTTAAVEAAGTDAFPEAGAQWEVAKFYWTVSERGALEAGISRIGEIPAGWTMPESGQLPSVPDSTVTAAVNVSPVMEAKLAALRAHETQVTVAPSGSEFVLSNLVAQPILSEEHFVLVRGQAGPVDERGREADLFAGVSSPVPTQRDAGGGHGG